MLVLCGECQQKSLWRSPDQVLGMRWNLERKLMGQPFSARRLDRFVAEILQRALENACANGFCHSRLFDAYKFYLSGASRIAFHHARNASEGEGRNWPKESVWLVERGP